MNVRTYANYVASVLLCHPPYGITKKSSILKIGPLDATNAQNLSFWREIWRTIHLHIQVNRRLFTKSDCEGKLMGKFCLVCFDLICQEKRARLHVICVISLLYALVCWVITRRQCINWLGLSAVSNAANALPQPVIWKNIRSYTSVHPPRMKMIEIAFHVEMLVRFRLNKT